MQFLSGYKATFKQNPSLTKIKQQLNDTFELIKSCNEQQQRELFRHIQKCISANIFLRESNKRKDFINKRKQNNKKLLILKSHKRISAKYYSVSNSQFPLLLEKNRKFFSCINHIRKHDTYVCQTCNRFFSTKLLAHHHCKYFHLTKNKDPHFRCPSCLYNFRCKYQLQKHVCKTVDQSTPVLPKPTIYNRKPKTQHCKKSQIKDKKEKSFKNYVCAICDKIFLHKHLLKRHINNLHKVKEDLLSCKYCSYKSYLKPNMERHLNLHFSNEKNCMCDHCGKTFTNHASLRDHIKYLHVQKKEFKCKTCEKCFKRKFELIRHQSCHSQDRPYICNLCQQSYKRLNHLSRHQKTAHEVVAKNKVVQRLKVNETGAIVPVPKKAPTNLKSASDAKFKLSNGLDNIFYLVTSNLIEPSSTNACILLQN